MSNVHLTIKEHTTLSLHRFKYERKSKSGDGTWVPIEDYPQMFDVLRSGYIDPSLTIRSMQTGVEVQTMWAWFRAIPVDAEPA